MLLCWFRKKGLSAEELMVFQHIEKSGNMGVYGAARLRSNIFGVASSVSRERRPAPYVRPLCQLWQCRPVDKGHEDAHQLAAATNHKDHQAARVAQVDQGEIKGAPISGTMCGWRET